MTKHERLKEIELYFSEQAPLEPYKWIVAELKSAWAREQGLLKEIKRIENEIENNGWLCEMCIYSEGMEAFKRSIKEALSQFKDDEK